MMFLLSRPLTFPGAKVGSCEKAHSYCFRLFPTVSFAAHCAPDKQYENRSESPLWLTEVTYNYRHLTGCEYLGARRTTRRRQFAHHIIVAPHEVAQVGHRRFGLGCVGKVHLRQLPFGVGANSESHVVHRQ